MKQKFEKITKRNVAKALRAGAAYLDEHPEHWAKGNTGTNGKKNNNSYCAIGCIPKANGRPGGYLNRLFGSAFSNSFPDFSVNFSVKPDRVISYPKGLYTQYSIVIENDSIHFDDHDPRGAALAAKILRKHARRLEHGGEL